MLRTLCLFAAAGLCFADAYSDFNTQVSTFNTQVGLWNNGPLDLTTFNDEISIFNIAVNSFNSATASNYADVSVVSAYSTVAPYVGSSSPIITFNNAVATFNADVTNFDSGSLSRLNFTSDVNAFNSAATNFNISGASPPAALEAAPPTYSLEATVTAPSVPEPSSVLLLPFGLILVGIRKRLWHKATPVGALAD